MKKLMLIAYGICFVLSQSTVSAQDDLPKFYKKLAGIEEKQVARFEREIDRVAVMSQNPWTYHDTLVINLPGNDKIFFIGKNFRKMVEFKKADSLKMLFLNDFEKAVSENSLSIDVQMVHYFVHSSGKRRLKAENPEYTDNKVDIAYEIKRLNQDLPKYRYIIHNLPLADRLHPIMEYELHIYVSNPEQLRNILSDISIDDVLHNISREDWRRNYKLAINTDNNDYQVVKKRGNKNVINSALRINYGASLLGYTIAPTVGGDLGVLFSDKYFGATNFLGLSPRAFSIVQMDDGKITGVSMVRSYDLKWMFHANSDPDKDSWGGLHAGFMKSNDMTPFNNAFKWGISVSNEGFVFSFDFIKCRDKHKIWAFTVTLAEF